MSKANDKSEILRKINEDEDYINYQKCENSLAVFEKKHPEGARNEVIAKALMVTEEEVEQKYDNILEILRDKVGVING